MSTKIKQNTIDLQAILNTINELPEAGGGDPVLQDKTVTPTTSKQTITADSGYAGLDTVTVNAMPTTTQATPAITVNASGLITATATQTSGYVVGGTKSATKQLAFQAAKTITPTTTNQTAVSSGYYTGGAITVKGDSNLVAGNIKSGVSIFGVNGTYEGSGGGSGDTSIEDGLITKQVTSYANDRVTSIGSYAFASCASLTAVSFPNVTSIGKCAFNACYNLTTVSFPHATTIGDYAFNYCFSRLTAVSFPNVTSICMYAFQSGFSLTTVSFPNATFIGDWAFAFCSKLTTVSFPKVISIRLNAFTYCSKLSQIYLKNSSVCSLAASNAFSGTSIWSNKGSIFVPSSLVASYKKATNWAFFSKRIFAAS